jgi:hypothetical protein
MHTLKVYRINTPQVISEDIDGEVSLTKSEEFCPDRMGKVLPPIRGRSLPRRK